MTKKAQTIVRNGTKPSIKGPENWFTGAVRIDIASSSQKNPLASAAAS